MATPAVGVLFLVFISQRIFKRATISLAVNALWGSFVRNSS
jgi:hypothetical protein